MRYGTASLDDHHSPEHARRSASGRFWSKWASRLILPPLHPDLVRRSALVLKALCYGPTGAIAAAATTSLPEWLGGVRNWDYRYCWPRDAAIAARSLSLLGSHAEGLRFLDWLLGVLDRIDAPDRLAPLYTVMGGELGPEGEISDLAGYAGSRPVRVGNAAASQIQLDVFGPIVDLIDTLLAAGAPLSAEHWRLTESMVEAVRARWRDPDHGIWEVRRPRDHHVHSKVMCWMTVDRALRIARTLLGEERAGDRELRDAIADDIFASGWNERLGAFSATYAGHDVDAATLLIGMVGLLQPDDPRFAGTVAAVEKRLLQEGAVYRYRYDDGLPGEEGAFNLCTAWLIECYALLGRFDEAHALFARYIKNAGETGLLTEEVDPHTGVCLGNVPQAYSHAGLINVAIALSGG
jgi:GH15 family glucan-1,4-alpha-glucosidase